MKNIEKRIFIVGCPRSGTTLLQSLLLKHNEITSFPESHFFSKSFLGKRANKYPTLYSNYTLYKWVDSIKQNNIFLDFRISFSRDSVVKKFISQLDIYTINQNKSVWIEKTPNHLHAIDIIEKYMPDAIFIHLIRDPKDNVASLYEATNKYTEHWNQQYTISEAVDRYNQDVAISKQYKDKNNHLIIKYEDLITNKKNIHAVFEYINLDILNVEDVNNYSSIVSNNEPWKGLNKNNKIVDTRNKKFNELFNEEERLHIQKNATCFYD
ncbi:MAG: sulfotransferase [Colwellia sp.]|nr:sulfotransferase [Colwellia sp.]